MIDATQRQGLEALLFLTDEPLDEATLAEAVEGAEAEVRPALEQLAATYERDGRGMRIREAGGGWRMYTAEAAYPVVERHVLSGRSGRLTQAALETLAVIAYKQPIARQDVSDVRGVNADAAVRSLVARGFVTEVGRDDGPGQAILYGTTPLFLERLGIADLDDLPSLTSFLQEEPAPDEPELASLKAARKHLAEGRDLPTTGRGRWQPGAVPEDDRQEPGDTDLAPPPERTSRREQDTEMDELTGALEQAARSAMAKLREAVEATEQAAGEEPGHEEEAPADTVGGAAAPSEPTTTEETAGPPPSEENPRDA